MKHTNSKEIDKLAVLLAKEGIPFVLNPFTLGDEVSIQIVSPDNRSTMIDAVCHQGSYGHEEELLEIYMRGYDYEKDNDDGVRGWLTAEEAFEYFKKTMK